MAIRLTRLAAISPVNKSAEIIFHPERLLIRGPSDTGKSYIRDCLWYLLGGKKLPKTIPEDEGYDSLILEFSSDGEVYEFKRGIKGGATAVSKVIIAPDGHRTTEQLDVNESDLLVTLSGADGKQLLRSKSQKGSVTGGDLRHWFLLSQPNVISEDPTYGSGYNNTQRKASFNLILTGSDDSAIQINKTNSEVERINGQISSANDAIVRAKAGIPSDLKREEVSDAIERVEKSLTALTTQYDARASHLKELRIKVSKTADLLLIDSNSRDNSALMIERFSLLDKKYASDLERLGATNEGIAFFQALDETPCPLCGVKSDHQHQSNSLKPREQSKFRQALIAEADKIKALRKGLTEALEIETARYSILKNTVKVHQHELNYLQKEEAELLHSTRVEFSADPKTLALRLSELSAQLNIFDEIDWLNGEISKLIEAKKRPKIPLTRDAINSSTRVADYAKQLLTDWGFEDIHTILLDPDACDLVINNRPRLGYGAGKRAIFLAAMTIALLKNAIDNGYPHFGFVVIDSPLKAYSDPLSTEERDIPVTTVTDKFYTWLATWKGPGQIIILENEPVNPETTSLLNPEEFSGKNGVGRPGFYLLKVEKKNDE